jgi:4-amino-4-deoxy-L-arabinose transferase-like glycosyltransferase
MDITNWLKKRQKLIIFFIFLIGFALRFFKLTEDPVSLSMDEVAIGYNAYSILATGKDEWGVRFPLAFRSAGDYKPPVDIYLTVPSIAVFGLNEFGVRFPVALLGSLTPLIIIFLLGELKVGDLEKYSAGIWFAISPWHIHFSRGGFEAITALCFLLLGTIYFLKSKRTKSYLHFSLGTVFLMLAVWSYHAERAFVPLLVIFLVITGIRRFNFLLKSHKKLLIYTMIFLAFFIPFLYLTFGTEAVRTRAISTSILRENSLIQILHQGNYTTIPQYLFDNDYYLTFRHFMGKYMNYYDLRFWFWKGMQYTPPEYPDMGLFYVVDLFLILPGIYVLFTSKNSKLRNLSLFWFFAGPVPAALTMNEQHPLRALVWLPFFAFAVAGGVSFWLNYVKKRHWLIGVFLVVLAVNVIYFGDMYFRQFPRFSADAWQFGYKEIALFACEHKSDYKNVYITDTFGSIAPINTGLPALYVLFYCKIDPYAHISQNAGFDNIVLRRLQWDVDKIPESSLIIGSYWDTTGNTNWDDRYKLIKRIYYPSGKPAFDFIDTRE